MTSLQPYTQNPYKKTVFEKEILHKEIEGKIEWRNLFEEDLLSFMDSFDFPDLEELKQSLTKSGEYEPKQIEEIIVGLKTLPEYRD